MQNISSANSNIIGLLDHMNELKTYLDEMTSLNKGIKDCISNPHASISHNVITTLGNIEECVKKADPLVMVIQNEIQFFTRYCGTVNAWLENVRLHLIEKIAERMATQVQMNTSAQLYDEANLLTKITVSQTPIQQDDRCLIENYVTMNQITEPKEYSVLSIVKQFESEEALLSQIYGLVRIECECMLRHFIEVRGHVTEIKSICNDTDMINCICEGDNTKNCIGILQACISNTSVFVSRYNTKITKIFQIYQELLHNYDIYMNAVETYTSFALECFFNPDSKYEF